MKMRAALFLAFCMAFGGAWAQQSTPQAPAELQPEYPGYSASNAPGNSASEPALRDAQPGNEASSGASSSGAYPESVQSSGFEAGVPQVEVRRLPDFPVNPLSPPAPMTRLEPVKENGITYLCGGVGLDEADHMKREARNYELLLTFATRSGNYLADVNVDIADARGQSLLKTTCGAPMMLVDLPKDGNYRISAETGGNAVSRTLQVRNMQHGRTVTLVLPTDMQKPSN